MNSWKSTVLSAWAPPLRTFIMRHRQCAPAPAQVLVERQAGCLGCGTGHSQRDRRGWRSRPSSLVVGAVGFEQGPIDAGLVAGVEPFHRVGKRAVDMLDRLSHAFAQVPRGLCVAELQRLTRPGRRTGRNNGPAHHSRREDDLSLDGGVAARIQDFTSDDIIDVEHYFLLSVNILRAWCMR